MRRVIVGTAGHIDHGKTKLVQALTGIDCDRWIEEKERGITIDLGFAHLEANDFQIGFIDVPGHEKFVHNALAGLGGIRILLLVVAADEGVKPQTREHLGICSLLEIPGCIVALTKTDLVDPDTVELARLEVEELLEPTPYATAPIIPVSSRTGAGLDDIRDALFELAAAHETVTDPIQPVRYPVDRAFHLKGLGVVVTGTLISGQIEPGLELTALPGDSRTRVRSVQVHGQSKPQAEAGERTALQLSGLGLEEVHRGVQLVADGAFDTTRRLLARLTLLPDAPKALKGSTSIRFHLYSHEAIGRMRPLTGPLAPGATGMVEIRLREPVVAVRSDRFVVRRPSPPLTMGGGVILDPQWQRRRPTELTASLEALTGSSEATLVDWITEKGESGTTSRELARRLGERPDSIDEILDRLESSQRVVRIDLASGSDTRWLVPSAFRTVADRATAVLHSYFKRDRLAQGMPKAELLERILPRRAVDLAPVYLRWLEAEKILVGKGGKVNLPGRAAELTGEESKLASDIQQTFEAAALKPPPPEQIRDRLGAKPQIFDGVVRFLVQSGRLVRLPGGLLISPAALDTVAEDLRRRDADKISVGDFKERFALSRKWAIPILEHLDSTGVTRRIGDQRLIVREQS